MMQPYILGGESISNYQVMSGESSNKNIGTRIIKCVFHVEYFLQ